MWSPTTETTAIKNNTATTTTTTATSALASDNKCKEENDDCRCSGSGSSASASSSSIELQQHQHQQLLNNFEINSKKQTSTFGGNSATTEKNTNNTADNSTAQNIDYIDQQKFNKNEYHSGGHNISEAIDSGFISGPQTTNSAQFFDNIEEEAPRAAAAADTTTNISKFNIIAGPQLQQRKQQESSIPDSGCIDEELADEDTDVDAAQQHQQHAFGESVTRSSHAALTRSQATNDPMILKHNVDAGMSEWFCNLSLQPDAAAGGRTLQQQQQQQQRQPPQQVAGIGMNNLDAISARRAAAAAAANRTQQQPASNAQITPTNAWEKFYKQNDDGDTPLHLAVIWSYVDVVAALLRMAPHPCLLDIQNDEAQTPLHLAARTSQPTIIRMLLLAGAEPTTRDRDGNTALHLACMNGEIQCVRTLLEKFTASEIVEAHRQFGHLSNDKSISSLSYARLPSDLEIRNYDGERCVHLAARNGNIEILRLLVLHGADINAREGRSGLTPLHIAIECCNENLANFLLDECEKINVETATYAGLTAYQVACMLNKSQLQTMLENYGAEPLTPPDSDYDSSDIEDLDDSKFYDRFGDPGYFIGYNGGNPMTVV